MSTQNASLGPGSVPRYWDPAELRRCGAIGTISRSSFDLDGDISPVFSLWEFPNDSDAGTVDSLITELHQPLLLASRILETVGLSWISEFCIEDIFDVAYPGRKPAATADPSSIGTGGTYGELGETPQVIVRHHRAHWASAALSRRWLELAVHELRYHLPKQVIWHLDGAMFHAHGWVGYTCRHPRRDKVNNGRLLAVTELDGKETIEAWDARGRVTNAPGRSLTVLVMRQYAAQLAELRRLDRFGDEEYILTAFMTAVTILHELGHVVYWRDFRAKNKRMTEPYFGADLEMELGDSFVAHIFGGWVPVPIASHEMFPQQGVTFKDGLAWKQHLSWDYHKSRPRYRAHYSVQVQHIATLFDRSCWASSSPQGALLRPAMLTGSGSSARKRLDVNEELANRGLHACAALPDFDWQQQCMCYHWRSSPAAPFRIVQYRGSLDLRTYDGLFLAESPCLDPAEAVACETCAMPVKIRVDLPVKQASDPGRDWERPRPRRNRLNLTICRIVGA